MEIEDLVDKYRNSKSSVRILLVLSLAVLPSLYIWMEEGDRIALDLEDVSLEESTARSRLGQAKRKVAQLPGLLNRLSEIETQLVRARNVLPDNIEIDRTLAVLGTLEAQYSVDVLKFTPGDEVRPANGLDYEELPIDLEIEGRFNQVMQFYDSLVHQANLTHLRSVEMERSGGEDNQEQLIRSKSRLILFKGR